MFGIGFSELLLIFVVALLVLGPNQMPAVARELAKAMIKMRNYVDNLKRDMGLEELERLQHLNSLDHLLKTVTPSQNSIKPQPSDLRDDNK